MTRHIFLFALTVLLMLGCERDEDRPAVETPEVDDAVQASMFDRIDADSVYVAANLEPLPEALSEKIWSALEPMMAANRDVYEEVSEEVDAPMIEALLNEFLAIDSRQAFEERGLHGNGLWAFHGLSIYPVLHWQLLDAEAFSATLERIGAGNDLPSRGIDGEEVIWIDLQGLGLAIHHDDHFVTAAIIPDEPSLLRRVANLDQPAEPFRQQTLSEFNRERGYAPQGSGFLDFSRLIDRVLDEDADVAAAGMQAITQDPACDRELRVLAGHFPRLSSGYTGVSEREMNASFRLETDPELGGKLAGIAEAPFNLDSERSGLFNAGLAFNLVAARDFARELVGGWVENPPECRLFENIAENAEEWQLALNRPIPPLVTNLHGFKLNLDRLELGEQGQAAQPVSDAAGTLAVFMRNPQMLIGMSQMFSPELAELDLRPGGEPQPLPSGLVPNMPELAAYIAMGESAIGLAVGEDQKDRLVQELEPGEADTALLRYGIDFAAYAEMMDALVERARAEFEEMEGDVEMPSNGDIFAAMAEIYDYSEMSIHLTPEGMEIASSITLTD